MGADTETQSQTLLEAIRKLKEGKRLQIRTEEAKASLYADDLFQCIKDPKASTRKL